MGHIYLKRTGTRSGKMARIAEIIGDDSDTAIIDFALNFTLASQHAAGEAARCLGYVNIVIPGDVTVCVLCGAEEAPLAALIENGSVYGPLCPSCVIQSKEELDESE